MMLRASIETQGEEADVRAVTDASAAEDSGVPGAAALVAFVEATLSGDADEIEAARDGAREAVGAEAMVDAAAVIGNFERMTRIADGTGIPLDTMVAVATEGTRAELGIDDYGHASLNQPVTGIQRFIRRVAQPIFTAVLRRRGRSATR